jgi:ribosomal protein S18 acetylase RimI-like enzyme
MAKTPFKVFRAGTKDLALARQAVGEVHKRRHASDVSISSFLKDPACDLMLAVADGRVVGSLTGYSLRRPHQSPPQFLLYEIDVRDADRKRGVGQALGTAFTVEARAAGADEIWVLSNESNRAALNLYGKCGYRRVNEDDVMLSLALGDDEPHTGTAREHRV